MVRSWSNGAAFAIATIGEESGSSQVYDPGYPADLYDVVIEGVVANTSKQSLEGVTQVGNVHYPPNECLIDAAAQLDPGDRVLLVLGPPGPSKDIWTVDGASSVLLLHHGSDGEVATWQGSSSECPGRVQYPLPAIADAAASGASEPPIGTCTAG